MYPSIINSSNYHLTSNNSDSPLTPAVSLRDLPFFSSGLKLEGLAAQLAEAHAHSQTACSSTLANDVSSVNLPRMSSGQISAFKKVDKSAASTPATGLSTSFFTSSLSARASGSNAIVPSVADQSTNLFSMPSSVNVRHSISLESPAVRASPSSASPPSNGNSINSGSGLNNNNNNNNSSTNNNNNITCNSKSQSVDNMSINNNNCIGKPLIAPSLLPFLPPSLAALSFPHTNWCAKCNASFRMTSDLVYHMRSHHKPFANSDPIKKKREEKLRCNICGESFRERHHLTRHLTSHQ